MSKEFDWSATHIACDVCGEMIPRGIISMSKHWCETHGKQQFDNIMKIKDMPLDIKDKMDLVKKEFNIES